MKRKFQDRVEPSTSSTQWMYGGDTRFFDNQGKDTLFVCYSGAQKSFADLLCQDLQVAKYSVFLDRDSEDLAKGEQFVAPLLRAAQECRLGILLLSEEFFTKSKWPMTELVTFVTSRESNRKQAPATPEHELEPRLLPLYYTLSRPDFTSHQRQASWFLKWEEWAKLDSGIDVNIWKTALMTISRWKGVDRELFKEKGDDAFRREVLKRITEFNIPPAICVPDGSIKGRIRMCQEIDGLFRTSHLTQKTGARVMGIHGTGGIGKSTLAGCLCDYYHREFAGRVCHLVLKGMPLLDLQKKVFQDLFLIRDQQILDALVDTTDTIEAWNVLDAGMEQQDKVFLVIDNIWEDQTRAYVERFLSMKFAQGSKMLLITRSMPVLRRVGIPVDCCESMPLLREEEAMELFIHAGNCDMKDEKAQANVRKWISYCCLGFSKVKEFEYNPLALKVLAEATSAALSRNPSVWDNAFLNFKSPKSSEDQIFNVLRLSLLSLPSVYRPIFVSLVLFAPDKDLASVKPYTTQSVESVCRWLNLVHNMENSKALLFVTRTMSVVEDWRDTYNNLRIHDLYQEFAEGELLGMQQSQLRASQVLYKDDKDDKDVPDELKTGPKEKTDLSQRHVLQEKWKDLIVLKLENCSKLKAVDIGYMTNLRYLVVEGCLMLDKIHGLNKLMNLVWLHWNSCPISLLDMPQSAKLQILRLEGGFLDGGKGDQVEFTGICKPPDLRMYKEMRELSLTKFPHLEIAPDLTSLVKVETLILNGCSKLKYIPDLSAVSNCLRNLHLCGCGSLERIPGLEKLTALLHLDLSGCRNLKKIPDLQQLKKLKFLDLSATAIQAIPGIQALHELEELRLNYCKNFKVLPDISNLHKLKKVFWQGFHIVRHLVTRFDDESDEQLAIGEKIHQIINSAGEEDPSDDESGHNDGEDNESGEKDGEDDESGDKYDDDEELESEHDMEEELFLEKEKDEDQGSEDPEYAVGDDDGDDDNNNNDSDGSADFDSNGESD